MSALQLQTSSRIVEAMGSMINDRQKVDQVIGFIFTLRDDYPAISREYLDANTISIDTLEENLTNLVDNYYAQNS